ncbi:MAG: hypothetical protein HDT32_02910 [Clostridiales bacterium]|nr:hypothetical protein [Clostridiales bacterium]
MVSRKRIQRISITLLSVVLILCLALCCATIGNYQSDTNAAVINSSSAYFITQDLLHSGRTDNKVGSTIFNGDALQELYEKLIGKTNATFANVESKAKAAKSTYSSSSVKSIHSGMNSEDIRNANGGQNIVVKIDNKEWIVTALTTSTDSHVILTLMLKDVEYTSVWNEYQPSTNNSSVDYPATMYSSSYVRAGLLNGTTQYTTTGSNKVSLTTSQKSSLYTTYPFSIYTDSTKANSIYNFIVAPNQVAYQQNENTYDAISDNQSAASNAFVWYSSINDSSLNKVSSTKVHTVSASIQDKTGYFDWGSDKLWLPSLAEVGLNKFKNSSRDFLADGGLWGLDSTQRAVSANKIAWLRSGVWTNTRELFFLESNGNLWWAKTDVNNFVGSSSTTSTTLVSTGIATGNMGVRPAFNLDLTAAEESSTIPTPQTKGDVKKYHASGDTTFELDKVFDDVMDIEITATGVNGVTIDEDDIPNYNVSDGVLSFTPSIVGEYTVKITQKDGYYWSDKSTAAKTYAYKLKYHVTPLELNVANPDNVIYSGDYQYLPLRYYDEDLVKVTVNNTDDLEQNSSGDYCIKVKDAKTYSTRIELVDKNLMEWTDNDGTENRTNISVTVKPKTLTITPSGAWKTSVRKGDTTYTLTCAGICANDVGKLDFLGYYTYKSGNEISVSDQPMLNSDNTQITITLPSVTDSGTTDDYKYILKLDSSNALSKNYTLTFSHAFEVEKESIEISAADIVWQYTNSNIAGGVNQTVDATTGTFDELGVFVVDYNKAEYTFSVDTKYADSNVYPTITTSLTGSKKEINANIGAGTYKIEFKIETLNNSIELKGTTTFELEWKIKPAKYDLSRLVWSRKDSTRTEYDGRNHEVVLTIPTDYTGLKATLIGTYKTMDAGTHTATASLTNTDTNYQTPIKNTTNTYDGSFLWDYQWKINPKQITLTWEDEPSMLAKDKNGVDFAYYVVSGEYKDSVTYKYYTEADYLASNWNNNIELNEFEVPDPPTLAWYWAVAEISDANLVNNLEIAGGEAKRFSLGSDKIDVVVTFKDDKYEFLYDGNAHGKDELRISVKKGSLSVNNDLVLTYYQYVDGQEVELDNEPTDSGSYKLVIALADDLDEYKLLRTTINFEINKVTVTIDNNTATDLYYNKAEQGLDLDVTSGGLTLDDIVIKYYNKANDEPLADNTKPENAGDYYAVLSLSDELAKNYDLETSRFDLTIRKVVLTVTTNTDKITYDGQTHEVEFSVKEKVSGVDFDKDNIIITYYKDSVLTENRLVDELPTNARTYVVVYSLKDVVAVNYEIENASNQAEFEIEKIRIKAVWNTSENIPVISNLDETTKTIVGYIYFDEEGNQLEDGATLEVGKSYKVKAILVGDNASNYEFVTEGGQVILGNVAEAENLEKEFTLTTSSSGSNVGIGNGEEPTPSEPQPTPTFDIVGFLKEYWQPILSIVSILLTIIFMSKGIGYAGKKKKAKKTIEKKYSTAYYAVGGVGLFNLPYTTWTVIACILAGVAVLAFIFMLLQKRAYNKALEEMEEAKEEYTRNREEANYMRYANGGMNMSGQAGVVYQQPQFAIEDMRGMINEAMSNMLPTVTQYLPQQASSNDELVQQLVEQNAQNEERIRQLTQENEERIRELTEQNQEIIRNLAQGQEILMQRLSEQPKDTVNEEVIEKLVEKLAKQQVEEKEAEKEVASAVVDEKTIEELKETIRQEVQSLINATTTKTVEKDSKDEKIEMLMRNQEMLMRQMMEMASRNNDKQVVMPYMSQPSERLMEKMIDLATKTAEKSTEKYVPVPVEKIVEKEVKVEVPVEKIVEVEKVVPMSVEKPAKATKTPAPRLTLDEAYAKLSATQKKIFDTLKNYALSKDKCKEKKSTYFTVLGQSTVNPLIKLTIKKNTTVALFKMEDEYMKDIRRGASSDGTKVKVKETEVVVGDNQALATAKDMIDLREDQIERYNDYLKEQRSFKKK